MIKIKIKTKCPQEIKIMIKSKIRTKCFLAEQYSGQSLKKICATTWVTQT